LYKWPKRRWAPASNIFAMTTRPATARFLLFPQVGEDERDVRAVKIRRYRLSRVDVNPPSGARKVTFDHLKRTHD
jgi:hypothetical protein